MFLTGMGIIVLLLTYLISTQILVPKNQCSLFVFSREGEGEYETALIFLTAVLSMHFTP